MALGASAAASGLAALGHPDLLTWGAHFLSAAPAGPVEVRVEVLRVGRTVSTAEMRIIQAGDDGRPHERVRMTGTFGTLDRAEPVHRAPVPPSVPSPDECLPATRDSSPLAAVIAVLDRLDARIDPSTAGFAVGRPSGRGVIRAWLRMRDGREPDATMLPYAVDALMPVSFDLGAPGWAPTMELTGQTLGRPAAGWLLVEMTTDTVVGDLLIEDVCVWDSTGRLVARSRQLAGVRLPGS
jgi:acyl-CoA thioesterase